MQAMYETSTLSVHRLMASASQPRCYGIAKNFFTNAIKADPNVAKPKVPLMFHKGFSS